MISRSFPSAMLRTRINAGVSLTESEHASLMTSSTSSNLEMSLKRPSSPCGASFAVLSMINPFPTCWAAPMTAMTLAVRDNGSMASGGSNVAASSTTTRRWIEIQRQRIVLSGVELTWQVVTSQPRWPSCLSLGLRVCAACSRHLTKPIKAVEWIS